MFSTDNEILEIVDMNDNVIGKATRAEIHSKNWIHRAVHIFVFNPKGEIYIQRRSSKKDRHPLKLDSSAAGHVDPGETYEQTALRELSEELSLEIPVEELFRLPASEETDYEHVVLFSAQTSLIPEPNSDEVHSGEFVSPDMLTSMMEEESGDFVPAFVILWKKFRECGT
jgi:isopentenyl-diphosphate Delta-isomerase